MTKDEAKKRIEVLKKEIEKYRYAYHVLDQSLISDEALDSLKKELFDLEQQFPEFISLDSPTQRVEGKPLKYFSKVTHEVPMTSLNDAFSKEDVFEWLKRIKKLLPKEAKLDFYCEQKFDGLAIDLEYENGIFIRGSTRGDGRIGEDVTQNLKTIEAIPLKLSEKEEVRKNLKKEGLNHIAFFLEKNFPKKIEARGEVILTKKEFKKINQEQIKKNLSPYANPRNVAAGSVRQLDPKITASRNLDSYAYDLVSDLGQRTHEEEHLILKALGFKTHKANKKVDSLEEVFKFYGDIENQREKLPYEIDGVVIIINNNDYFKQLGIVGKAPRGALAFKFPPKETTTIVEDIIVQVGRTGVLTPVAVLTPKKVGGVMVSRATLHNKEEIKRLGLKIGDTVIVSRAGDVIPQIVKVLPHLRTGKEKEFKLPKKCPVCGTELKEDESGIIVRCPNADCPARSEEHLYHFVGKGAFDIKGVGPKLINRLLDEGLIQDAADLFSLKEGDVALLERYGEKSSKNIISAIQKAKIIPLNKFLYSLGILNVGEETALLLAEFLQEKNKGKIQIPELIKALLELKKEELEKVPSIGPKISEGIISWEKSKNTIIFLEKLKNTGIKLLPLSMVKEEGKLKGLSFVFTGTMKLITREEAKNRVIKEGGKVSESVSSKTDYLVCGEEPGAKYDKAKKLGVKIIAEKEFLKIING
ncbi:MAG: NAD-dependent DNA ligase LigA [Candidatus Pacebacteria bacterium]|nr:NAD-dependent DNA ligase LigA [Candidatus Paceibacterota bacterium]